MKPFSPFLNKLFIISSKKCGSSFIDNETSIGSNLIIPTLLRDKKEENQMTQVLLVPMDRKTGQKPMKPVLLVPMD
jgi:hypothetical protein